MNIVPLGFLDIATFAATYVQKYRAREHPLILRGMGGDATVILNEWKSAKALLTRVKNAAAPFFGGVPAELGGVYLDTLRPGESVPWAADESEYRRDYHDIVVCILPSPGAWVYCGGESAVLPWGQVTAINRAAMTSEVNFGPSSRTNLVIGVKRPDRAVVND